MVTGIDYAPASPTTQGTKTRITISLFTFISHMLELRWGCLQAYLRLPITSQFIDSLTIKDLGRGEGIMRKLVCWAVVIFIAIIMLSASRYDVPVTAGS